jgi:hypothetical protein
MKSMRPASSVGHRGTLVLSELALLSMSDDCHGIPRDFRSTVRMVRQLRCIGRP